MAELVEEQDRQDALWQRFTNWVNARRFAYGLVVIALIVMVLGFLSQLNVLNWIEPVDQFIGDFYANTTAELLSIALTVIVINAFNQRRATEREKAALILQMGSPDNAFAVEAVR